MAKEPDGSTATAVWTSNAFSMDKISIGIPGESSAVIDVSHLGLTKWKIMKPGTFEESKSFTITGQYDPTLTIPTGVNDSVTITFPASGSLLVWGFISDYTPGDLVIDGQVEATIEFTPSNLNGSDAETGPVYST